MDEVDRANAQADQYLALCLRSATAGAARLPAIGACHYCGEAVGPGALFCPAPTPGDSCATDWEREQRMRRISGR